MELSAVLRNLRPQKFAGFKPSEEQTIENALWAGEQLYTEVEYAQMDNTSNLVYNEEVSLYTVSPFTIPTQQECQECWNNLLWEGLKKRRNYLLFRTDKFAIPDWPHPTEEVKQAWLDYRQALRDLPANTEDPSNPTWPVRPDA